MWQLERVDRGLGHAEAEINLGKARIAEQGKPRHAKARVVDVAPEEWEGWGRRKAGDEHVAGLVADAAILVVLAEENPTHEGVAIDPREAIQGSK